jgi:hypothetical protein
MGHYSVRKSLLQSLAQWLSRAITKGRNRVGTSHPPHLRTETIQFPKVCVLYNIRRQTKSKNPENRSVIHHHQSPLESNCQVHFIKILYSVLPGVQSAGCLDIHFTVGISCKRAAPLAKKNAAARHHLLRSLISLHNEHPIYDLLYVTIAEFSRTNWVK